MANFTALAAEVRDRAGKGAARAMRRSGRIPAVIYGNKQDSVLISLDPLDLAREMRGQFFSSVYEISVGDDKFRVLARDVQLDPVSDRPLHVDFMRFSRKTRVVVEVACNFLNEEECPGIRRGGVLNVVRYAIEMRCSPENIPDSIDVDLEGLEIGDSVHVSALDFPEDVELTITDRDFTVATIAAPTIVEEETEEDEEGLEMEEGEEGAEEGEGEEEAEAEE